MEFVSFDIAKKLKEKGFPQVKKNTLAMYGEDGCIYHLCPTLDVNSFYYAFDDFDEHDCVCPTISQVLKWLREQKKIEIVASFDYEDKTWGYQVGDMTLTEDSILAYRWNFPTYEQAALAGIEFILDNINP